MIFWPKYALKYQGSSNHLDTFLEKIILTRLGYQIAYKPINLICLSCFSILPKKPLKHQLNQQLLIQFSQFNIWEIFCKKSKSKSIPKTTKNFFYTLFIVKCSESAIMNNNKVIHLIVRSILLNFWSFYLD